MAIWDTLSAGGVSLPDLAIIGTIFVIVIGLAWYLKHRQDKGVSGNESYYRKEQRSEKRGEGLLKRGWKKFLSIEVKKKQAKKEEIKIEETEKKIYTLEKELINPIKEIIVLINQYKAKPEPDLITKIVAKTKLVLAEFSQVLSLINAEVNNLHNWKKDYERWKQLIEKENRNYIRDLKIIIGQIDIVKKENSLWKGEKLRILNKKYAFVLWLKNSNLYILQKIVEIENILDEALNSLSHFYGVGNQLKEEIHSNKKLYVLGDLMKKSLMQLKTLDKFMAERSIRSQKSKLFEAMINKQLDEREKIFASLKELDKEYNKSMEEEKLAEIQRKEAKKGVAEVKVT